MHTYAGVMASDNETPAPTNDSPDLADAVRSIHAIGENETGATAPVDGDGGHAGTPDNADTPDVTELPDTEPDIAPADDQA